MAFQFWFTFIILAKGFSCAAASKGRALILQIFFLPGCTFSMDKLASLFYPGCCLHPTLGKQLRLLKFQLSGWRKTPRCGCSGLCREKDLAVQYLLTDWKMSKLKDSFQARSECPVRTREWQDLGLYSKSTHPGAHLEFLMLCLSFHYCVESLLPLAWRMHKEDKKGILRDLLYLRLLYLQ